MRPPLHCLLDSSVLRLRADELRTGSGSNSGITNSGISCGCSRARLLSSRDQTVIGKHIVLTLVVGAGVLGLFWTHPPNAWTPVRVIGMALIMGGFVLWTIARFQLGASFAVQAEARQLVTRGLYSKIRNPIYVFGSLVVAGGILVFGRPVWLLVFVLLIPLQLWRARKESAVLEAAFGDEYRRYRAGTWF